MATSYYASVRSDRDRELRSYEAQTDAWLKAKREGGMLPDFAGGMAASRQGGMMFGGSGSRDMQSYSMFRQWVYCAVAFIAKRMAGQPWSAGELTNAERDGKKPPKKSHELSLRQPWLKHTVAKSILRRNAPNQDLDVFQSHAILDTIDRPNPLQRRSEFMYMSVASLLLTGVCYWVGGKVKGKKTPNDKKADGDKIELWAIPSHLVEPLHKDGLFSHYKIKMSAQDMGGQEIPAANVARTYIPDPSDIMGVFSPLNACIRAIRTDDHVQGSQEGLFARGLMPHVGVVIGEAATQQFAPILTGPQRHQIERMIVELYNRTTNDGMPAIFDGMIKDIRRLDPMPREMDWKVSGEIVRDRILRAYGISLLLLGDTQGGNRAQAVMAEENAAANVFNPLADTFTETACDWLAPMFEAENTSSRIWAWINPFVAHDEEMTSRQWDSARKNGDVDRNEYRAERLGLPPREDEIQKSALVETVGGVTGAIAVSTAVGQGVIEPDQAAVIFQQFFGFDAKVAKQLAGEKKPQPPAPGPGAPGQPPFGSPVAAAAEKPAEEAAAPAPVEPTDEESAAKAYKGWVTTEDGVHLFIGADGVPRVKPGGKPVEDEGGDKPKPAPKPADKPADPKPKPAEKPKPADKPDEKPEGKHVEGQALRIGEADRKTFLDDVAKSPGGKLNLDKAAVAQFNKDGDAEKLIAALDAKGGRDNFVGSLRVNSLYAEKHGGIDVTKSEALMKVRDKSAKVKLSDDEVTAIREYTTDAYNDVNAALRSGKKMPKGGKEMVDAVTKAVDDVGEWDKPAMIYRGIDTQSAKQQAAMIATAKKHIEEGTEWVEKGITSTSASERMSRDWVANSKGGGILMRINAKRGALISQFTGLSGQQEIIQKPGSRYKPTKVIDGKPTIIEFEQV